jgi:hypothetical protein
MNPYREEWPSSVMRRRVSLLRTDVSEERVTSLFRVEKFRDVSKALAVRCAAFSVQLNATFRRVSFSNFGNGMSANIHSFLHSFFLGATTLYEFWPAQQLTSIYFYPMRTFSN